MPETSNISYMEDKDNIINDKTKKTTNDTTTKKTTNDATTKKTTNDTTTKKTTNDIDTTIDDTTIKKDIIGASKKIDDKKKRKMKIKNLVLSGGGLKGIAFLGAHKALCDLDIFDPKKIAGTSVGALFGLLIILNYRPEELYSFVTTFDYNDVRSFDFMNCLKNWGIDTGDKATKFICHLVKRKVDKFDMTFKELYEFNPIEFTVVATHLNVRHAVYYNYHNYPNESVILTIRKSISLPGIFTPVKCNGQVFVDGGLLDNFPVQIVPDSKETLGIYFSDFDDVLPNIEINKAEDYIINIFWSVLSHNTMEKVKQIKHSHMIHINSCDASTFDFFLDTTKKKKLYDDAYQKLITFFEKKI